jgi:hypothetical protein
LTASPSAVFNFRIERGSRPVKRPSRPAELEPSGVEGWLKRSVVLFITVPERCQLALGIS